MTDKNGKHPGIQLDINAVKLADITGDLTPIAEGAGKTLGAVPTLLHRLCLLIFGDWYTDRICRDMKKRAQAEHDCEAIRQGALTLFSGQWKIPRHLPPGPTRTPPLPKRPVFRKPSSTAGKTRRNSSPNTS